MIRPIIGEPKSLFLLSFRPFTAGTYPFQTGILELVLNKLGDLSEWLKEHAWKVCIPLKGIEGSNPSVSATLSTAAAKRQFLFLGRAKLDWARDEK